VDTRRRFLLGLVITGTMLDRVVGAAVPQNPTSGMPQMPVQAPGVESPNAPSPEKRALVENEKDIKKKVEKLYELATQLKAEVDKTDSSRVLSLNLLKKAEEIEKLAREIKNRSKG
jgi:hypothetical protein